MSNQEKFKAFSMDKFEEIHQHTFRVENSSFKKESKLFLKELLDLSGMEISYNIFKPSEEMPFFHTHNENEEVYIIVKGEAEFTVDGKVISLQEGSCINVKPQGSRSYKNLSDTDELVFMVIQAKEDSLNYANIKDGVIVE